jgi:hypothetical protein
VERRTTWVAAYGSLVAAALAEKEWGEGGVRERRERSG